MKSDRAVFEKYYRVNTVQYEAATADNCDQKCQLFHFCAQHELNYARFESCVGAGEINNRSNLSALPGSLVLLIALSFMLDWINCIEETREICKSAFEREHLNIWISKVCSDSLTDGTLFELYSSNARKRAGSWCIILTSITLTREDKLRIALTTIDGQSVAAYLIMEHGLNQAIRTNRTHLTSRKKK